MGNLMVKIRELQVRQETIVDDIKATRVDQKEMAAIRAGGEEIRAAISHVRYAQSHFESTLHKRIQSMPISMARSIQSFLAISRHEALIIGLVKQLANTLPEATKRKLETKLAEAEGRTSHEGSGNAAICVDRGRPLLPGTKRLVCLPCGETPQKGFLEEYRPKPEKREQREK
jgi:hypothetical protein